MTNRERLLAIMAGQSPDRIPWTPRLEIWYEAQKRRGTMPPKYKGWTLRQIEHDLGLGTPARGGQVYRTVLHDVEVQTREAGNEVHTQYLTPIGTVSTVHRYSDTLARGGINTRLEVGHMIQSPDDYAVVEYMTQHTEIVPTYEEYLAYEQEVGEDGVPLVSIGADPLYRVLREFIGYNHFYYHLSDYPEHVEHLLGVLGEQAETIQQVTLDSSTLSRT
jgi:hypothetical protein